MLLSSTTDDDFVFLSTISLDEGERQAEVHADFDGDEFGGQFSIQTVLVDGKDLKDRLDIHQIHELETEVKYWQHRAAYDEYMGRARDRYEASHG